MKSEIKQYKIKELSVIKKNYFFLCTCKMVNIAKEIFENNTIESIIDGIGTIWFDEKHLEEKLGH